MILTPLAMLSTIRHDGYRGWLGHNPNIQIEPGGITYYCCWGDGDAILEDMAEARKHGKCIFNITGDKCYVPTENDGNYYFVTTINPQSKCYQMTVPYSYHSSRDMFCSGEGKLDWNGPRPIRSLLANFRGSFATNPRRARLKEMEAKDIVIEDCDGWQSAQRGEWGVIERHHHLLMNSYFTLCPRGIGNSSIRVMEAIFRGSVPVLLDDLTHPFCDPMDFALRFPLSGNLNDLEYLMRHLLADTVTYNRKLDAMAKFRNDYLLIDDNHGCVGTIGYSEIIRSIVEK